MYLITWVYKYSPFSKITYVRPFHMYVRYNIGRTNIAKMKLLFKVLSV